MKRIDLTGQQFGRWTVLEFDEEKTKEKRKTFWICQCSCENHTIRSINSELLRKGKSKSCGCLKGELLSQRCLENLSGQKFGKWTVLNSHIVLNGRTAWLCECSCNKHTQRYIYSINLKRGLSTSCGCNCRSRGEIKIRDILKENNIEFIEQYTLEVSYIKKLSLDFYLPKYQLGIEYQGEQYYKPIDFFGGEENFKIQQERDVLKRRFCKENQIKLIEIPYWDYDIINEEYLLNLLN